MRWLKVLRVQADLSQVKLSELVGITQQYYSNIESGKKTPSPTLAMRIGRVLNFPWTRFFDDPMPTTNNKGGTAS